MCAAPHIPNCSNCRLGRFPTDPTIVLTLLLIIATVRIENQEAHVSDANVPNLSSRNVPTMALTARYY